MRCAEPSSLLVSDVGLGGLFQSDDTKLKALGIMGVNSWLSVSECESEFYQVPVLQ